jgi:predicted DNA-binding ribbon-helix-helix protein
MLDPKEILAACSSAHEYGQNASGTMAQPFISSISDMSVASSSNASNLIGNVQQTGGKMLDHMSSIKASVDQQVAAHQDAQRRQKTYDFNVNMNDLRPTNSVGFPEEMPGNFFAPFKTGK